MEHFLTLNAKSFGHAHLSTHDQATPDSLYYIASLTKSFTATTLLSLLEELETGKDDTWHSAGKINLKTKIRTILPDDFALADHHATSHATLEDALGHRLGVGANDFGYGGTPGYTVRDAVRSLRHLPMIGELRERHEYLNLGYITVQHVIETLTGGVPIEEAHRRYIWEPLGMPSTYPSLQAARGFGGKKLCTGYTYDPLAKTVQMVAHVDDYPLIGGGGVISSIRDMAAYLRAVMRGTLPLGKAYQAKLLTPLSIPEGRPRQNWSPSLYCLGWTTASYRGFRVVSHSGGISGFGSKLLYLPDRQWGVAVLANASSSLAAIEPLLQMLLDEHLGVPVSERDTGLEDRLSRRLEHSADHFHHTHERIYPRAPHPPLPTTLSSLADYAGTYTSPSHQTVTLTVAAAPGAHMDTGGTELLHAELKRLETFTLNFEHVSGDFFIAWGDVIPPTVSFRRGLRAQFVVGSAGTVERMGINFEPMTADGDDLKMTWFQKV